MATEVRHSQALTDQSGAVELNCRKHPVNVIDLTVDGDATVSFTNTPPGTLIHICAMQDATGGHAITFSGLVWPGGSPPTFTTAATRGDIFTFITMPDGDILMQSFQADFNRT